MIITQHECIVGNDLADKVHDNIRVIRHDLRVAMMFTVDHVIGYCGFNDRINQVYRLPAIDMTFRLRGAISHSLRRIHRKRLEKTVW